MFASAFATVSRSMLGVGLAVWLAWRGVGHETRWKRRSITGLSALAIALGLFTYAFTTFHLESRGGHTARPNFAPSAYLTLHGAAIDMFGTSPWVGLGPGSFSSALRAFSSSEKRALIGGRAGSSDFWDPHSAILGLAAEQGLAGLAAFAWLVAEIYRRIGSGRDPGHRSAAIAALTGLLVGGYFVDWFPFKGLWLWIGLLVSASRPERPPRD
jgi:O-antigen ligase